MARKQYTETEVEQALQAVALHRGPNTRAREFLKVGGLDVPTRTLGRWAKQHSARVAEITREKLPQIEQAMLSQTIDTIVALGDAEREAIELSRRQIADGTIRDAPAAVRNLSTSKGINHDKLFALTGRPVATVQHDVQADIALLVKLGVVQEGWDSTTVEEPLGLPES